MSKPGKKNLIQNIRKTIFLPHILFLIAIALILGAFFFGKSKGKVQPNKVVTQFPYIDFSRSFVDQEHYITNIQPLRERLFALSKDFGNDKVSVYIEFLNTGANISINPENYIFPASLLKLPIGMVAMKKVELGQWKLTNELVLMEGDKDFRSGDLKNLLADYTTGSTFTIEKLIEELIINSDNTAYNIFSRNLGNDDVKTLVDAIGLDKLADEEGKISAKEYSRVLRSLYTASYLNRVNSQKILTMLDRATFDDYLAGPIDPSVPFSHKYGRNITVKVYADSGIVYLPNRPYIISVLVQLEEDESEEVVSTFMQTISKETYEYFLNYNK